MPTRRCMSCRRRNEWMPSTGRVVRSRHAATRSRSNSLSREDYAVTQWIAASATVQLLRIYSSCIFCGDNSYRCMVGSCHAVSIPAPLPFTVYYLFLFIAKKTLCLPWRGKHRVLSYRVVTHTLLYIANERSKLSSQQNGEVAYFCSTLRFVTSLWKLPAWRRGKTSVD